MMRFLVVLVLVLVLSSTDRSTTNAATNAAGSIPISIAVRSLQLQQATAMGQGWQSSESSGSSFAAAAAVYDAESSTVYITGSTTSSSSANNTTKCFFAAVSLDDSNSSSYSADETRVFDDSFACTALAITEEDTVYLAGYQESPSSALSSNGPAIISGMIFEAAYQEQDQEQNASFPNLPFNLYFANSTNTAPVVYPVSMTASIKEGIETFFAVSRDTVDTSRNTVDDADLDFPYGSSAFAMSVYRMQSHAVNNSSSYQIQAQRFTFATTANGATVSIYASALVLLRDGELLIVVGSTAGQSEPFGRKQQQDYSNGDLDGFVLKLNGTAATGAVYEQDEIYSTRIESVDLGDDRIHGLCHSPQDEEFIYLVGTTTGKLPGTQQDNTTVANATTNAAYVIKMTVGTLETVWTVQLGGSGPVTGTACAVSSDGGMVWLAGVAHDGAVVDGARASAGGDDIFVAQIIDGQLVTVQQMGTAQDEGMANGLYVDSAGNAIVTGHTFGSWFRQRNDTVATTTADLFVTTISRQTAPPSPTTTGNDANTTAPSTAPTSVAPATVESISPTPSPSETTSNVPGTTNAANVTNTPTQAPVATTTEPTKVNATGDAEVEPEMSGAPSRAPNTTTGTPVATPKSAAPAAVSDPGVVAVGDSPRGTGISSIESSTGDRVTAVSRGLIVCLVGIASSAIL